MINYNAMRSARRITVEEALILQKLVQENDPQIIVEFTTYGGLATLAMAEHFRFKDDTNRIISYDYADRSIIPSVEKYVNESGLGSHISLVKATNKDVLINRFLDSCKEADFIFIDDLHEEIDSIWKALVTKLKDSVILVFHDVNCEPADAMRTPTLFSELSSKFESNIYSTKDDNGFENGIGVIYFKKESSKKEEVVEEKVEEVVEEKVEEVVEEITKEEEKPEEPKKENIKEAPKKSKSTRKTKKTTKEETDKS